MMTDRELLELAAKATGVELKYDTFGQSENADRVYCYWNPLEDDAEALQLAVQLGFVVEPGKCWHSHYGPVFGEDVLMGVMAATRRAIVRAAAEIGAQM